MAGQGNYVNTGSINANWGQGLSASLSDLSKTLLGQAQANKENELALADREERRRQFDVSTVLERDKLTQNKSLSERQFALQKNANDIALSKHEAEQEKERVRRLTNQAYNNITTWEAQDKTFDQLPKFVQETLAGAGNSLNAAYDATDRFLQDRTPENLEAAKNARIEYLKYRSDDPDALVELATTFTKGLEAYMDNNSVEGVLSNENREALLSKLYDNDYRQGQEYVRSGTGMLLREGFEAWKSTLDPTILEYNTDEDLFKAYSARSRYSSRDSLKEVEAARIEQLREDHKEQIGLIHDFNTLNKGKGITEGTKAYEALNDIIGKDIGPIDTKRAIAAFNSLVQLDGISVDGALGAITSSINDGNLGWDRSFPDLSDKKVIKDSGIIELARAYSKEGATDTANRKDYLLERFTPRSIEDLVRSRLSFTPSMEGLPAIIKNPVIRENEEPNNPSVVPKPSEALKPTTQARDVSGYLRPAGAYEEIDKQIAEARDNYRRILAMDKEDREITSGKAYGILDRLRKQKGLMEFSDRRIIELNNEIDTVYSLMNRPGVGERDRNSYKVHLDKLLKEIERHRPR